MALSENEKKVLARAARITLREMLALDTDVMSSPRMVHDYLKLKVGLLPYEVFGMLVLNNRHRVIGGAPVELFRGTIDSTAVYPRECLVEVLKLNGAAVIYYHNHPSLSVPLNASDTDIRLTRKLSDAFSLLDIRTLDHIIVSGDQSISMAEKGLM